MHHGELLSIAKQNNKEIYTQDRLEQEIKNRLHKGKLNIIEVKPINILQHNLFQKSENKIQAVDEKVGQLKALIDLFKFDHLFYLKREDQLARLVSIQRARMSNVWHTQKKLENQKFKMPIILNDPNILELQEQPIEVVIQKSELFCQAIASSSIKWRKIYSYENDIDNNVQLVGNDILLQCGLSSPQASKPITKRTRASNNPYEEILNANEVLSAMKKNLQ